MEPIVVSHSAAIRGIRHERRCYGRLTWEPLSRYRQQRVLESCVPNLRSIDFEELERHGFWGGELQDRLDVLVGDANARRSGQVMTSHLISKDVPSGSICRVTPSLHSVSPVLTVPQLAETHTWIEVLAYIMEMCGTCSLPEDEISALAREIPRDIDASRICAIANYYRSEPVLTVAQIKRFLRNAKGLRGATRAREAARYALDGADSPTEIIMDGMLHVTKCKGGFDIKDLQLNCRIDFNRNAVLASGMPYAKVDAFSKSSKTVFEYNGGYHDDHAARVHDELRTAGLEAMGLQVIPINDAQLRSIDALEAIAQIVYKRAGRRFRYETNGYRKKQLELLNGLRQAVGLRPC